MRLFPSSGRTPCRRISTGSWGGSECWRLSRVLRAASLLLAALGLYGVMAYAVAQRTREVGIRVALGAERREIVRMILRESMAPVLVGIGAGIAAALATNRLIAGLLFGVAPRDPVSIAISAAVLVLVGVAAAAIPARRASLVEPTVALRCD